MTKRIGRPPKDNPYTARASVNLTPGQKARLVAIAERRGVSTAQLLRGCVERILRANN